MKPITSEEILAAEKAADNRKRSRAQGFDKMHERDASRRVLSNGVTMLWYVHPDQRPAIYEHVPEDCFAMIINGHKYIFNTEEFRRNLRWA